MCRFTWNTAGAIHIGNIYHMPCSIGGGMRCGTRDVSVCKDCVRSSQGICSFCAENTCSDIGGSICSSGVSSHLRSRFNFCTLYM